METKNKYKLSIIAGKTVLNRIMSWVYISEDLNTAEFLQGGELVITTGVNCDSTKDWLYSFIKTMISQNTAGLIINTGKYISPEDITDKIIEMCELAGYPLFLMPWNIHIYDISKDYYNRIFLDSQEDSSVANAFSSVIHQDSDYTKSIHILEDHQFPISSMYYVCVIDISQLTDTYTRSSYSIHSLLRKSKIRCQLIHLQTKLILVCNDDHYDQICQVIKDIHEHLSGNKQDLLIHEGIGGLVTSLNKLNTGYDQANAALSMAHFHKKSLYHYEDMGFFKILLAVKDTALLNNYANHLLGEIMEYDQHHNSNYSETLRSFLVNNGSIQAIATELYCHRNTINYRVRTLKDSFGLQLDDPGVRYDLTTAFLIQDFLKLQI